MCIEFVTITAGICPSCEELSQHRTFERRCYNRYLQRYMDAADGCVFPQTTTQDAVRFVDGQWPALEEACYNCTFVTPPEEDTDFDPLERDLDQFMAALTDTAYLETHTQTARDATLQRQMLQAQELMRRLILEEPQAHLNLARARFRREMRARLTLFLYRGQQSTRFDPALEVEEAPEIIDMNQRCAAAQMEYRQATYDSDDTAVDVETDRAGWRDLSDHGRLNWEQRIDRYFHGRPIEPFEEPLIMQLNRCASEAETQMLLDGYEGSVMNEYWRRQHSYWRDEDSPTFFEGVTGETHDGPSVTSRLAHLGVEESDDED